MRFNKVFGSLVRELRAEKKLTLRELASRSNIALAYLSEIENGKKEASSVIMSCVATGLGVPLYQIIVEVGYRMMPTNELDKRTETLYTQYQDINLTEKVG